MIKLKGFTALVSLIAGIFFLSSVSGPKASARASDPSTAAGKGVNGPLNVCTWNGSVSSAWTNGGNWTACGGVQPQPGDSVIIGAGAPNDPILTSTAPTSGNLSSITVNSVGKLDISNSGVLNTNADFSLNGGRLRFFFDGTLNVGPTAETNFIYTTGSTLIFVPGSTGSLNIGGRLSPSVVSDTITYNQTSGTVRVAMFGSGDGTFGAFSIPASGSTFQMSGTAVIIQREPTAIAQDYVNLAATTNSVTGGTVQFGDGSTVTGSPHLAINSSAPIFNLTLSAISGLRLNIRDHTIPVLGSLTIQSGAQLDDNDNVPKGASVGGDWINDGTFTSQDIAGGNGLITFNGGATQNISGSSPTTFHDLTINSSGVVLGQTITVKGTLTLTSGNITTNANTVVIASGGAVSRTSGHVIGNLQKTYSAPASKTFEVGTANGYSPVDVNVTVGFGDFTVKATQGAQPNIASPTHALQRYWTLTAAGMTADLTFHYLDPTDIPVTANENNFIIFKYAGSFSTPGGSVNTGANTATINGLSSFSDWTLAEPTAPTAARATISGQITKADGRPVGGVTVDLGGNASDRTITNEQGQYRFDSVETQSFYTVTPSLVNYSFGPASRSFSLTADKTDAVFTGTSLVETENPLNVGDFFVRQQYLDFLGREPDHDGWLFWTAQLARCGADEACVRQRRIDISAAFFSSEEFQQSGNYVYRLYRAGLGRQLTFGEFSADHPKVIGGANLSARRQQFADDFVQRVDFVAKYQSAVSAEVFVDSLLQTVLQNVNLDLTGRRDQLIVVYNGGEDLNRSRSAVLQTVAEASEFKSAVYNPSFVLMEYFGYLRRDADANGFQFWVNVLNDREAGNYRGMVCSFVTSAEYQRRFGTVVNHSNSECAR